MVDVEETLDKNILRILNNLIQEVQHPSGEDELNIPDHLDLQGQELLSYSINEVDHLIPFVLHPIGDIIGVTKAPRLKELLMAVLANLARDEKALDEMLKLPKLIECVFYTMTARDTHVLKEVIRFIHTCSTKYEDNLKCRWQSSLKVHTNSFISYTQAYLEQSKDENFLDSVLHLLVDLVFDDEDITQSLSNDDFIVAILTATKVLMPTEESSEEVCLRTVSRPLLLLHNILRTPGSIESLKDETCTHLLRVLARFSRLVRTTRVLYKEYDKRVRSRGHRYDEDEEDGGEEVNDGSGAAEPMSAGHVAVTSCINLFRILFQIKRALFDDDMQAKEHVAEMFTLADVVYEAFGVLSAIQVYFPNGSPWSDSCYRDDTLLDGVTEPPDDDARTVYEYCEEVRNLRDNLDEPKKEAVVENSEKRS